MWSEVTRDTLSNGVAHGWTVVGIVREVVVGRCVVSSPPTLVVATGGGSVGMLMGGSMTMVGT